jgi:hypothetical protein
VAARRARVRGVSKAPRACPAECLGERQGVARCRSLPRMCVLTGSERRSRGSRRRASRVRGAGEWRSSIYGRRVGKPARQAARTRFATCPIHRSGAARGLVVRRCHAGCDGRAAAERATPTATPSSEVRRHWRASATQRPQLSPGARGRRSARIPVGSGAPSEPGTPSGRAAQLASACLALPRITP